jgi:glycosyltransferase involved in cell wall biosynthesis
MISVLIPTYNYNVYPLVKEIHKQLSKQGIDFEIRVYDDASQISFETEEFLQILPKVVYKKFKTNVGRTRIRHLLAIDALYSQLLFLDADMFPKDRFFVAKMIKTWQNTPADIYFGGIQVPPSPPSPQKTLRWKYGKERESLPVEERKKNPYKSIISGAIFINKETFLQASEKLKDINRYGLDIYFSYLLKEKKAVVHHYNNPIMHLGLEDSSVFISKTKEAVETLYFLLKHNLIPSYYSKLGKTGCRLKKYNLCKMVGRIYSFFHQLCYKHLISSSPSLAIFDLYKLCYFCKISR